MELLTLALDGFRGVAAPAALQEQARRYLQQWLTQQEFAAYRPQLEWLIGSGQWAGLLDRFCQIVPFGTGGRRGAVGIGPNRMNLWTLGASVQGHCEYLKERFPGVKQLQVAVAWDVRQFEDQRRAYNPNLANPVLHLSSRAFARHAVAVYAANGIHAWLLPEASPRYLATPELSFIIRQLGAHGGLNISASHNPPDDNGCKFYDERGGQPVPPDDQIMADLVDQVGVIKTLTWDEAVHSGRVHFLDDSTHRDYIALCRRQSLVSPPHLDEIKVVYTPLHGVGSMTAMEVLIGQGFRVRPVEEQMKPDGQFANVTGTPNPEVPACMDRAEALARQLRADLVLATDPDADRLGGMIPLASGEWRPLGGHDIAALLTHFKLSKLHEQGTMPRSPIVVKTLVTTGQVTRIAHHFAAQVVEDLLVGFKYIADVLWQLEQNGCYGDVEGTPADFVLGCEESLGILLTAQMRDKDAGATALLLAEVALDRKRRGSSVEAYLEDLARQFGYFRHEARNVVLTGLEGKQQMAQMLDRLRASPPAEIAGVQVTAFEDLRDEDNWLGPIKGATDYAARNFLIFRLGEQARIALRPSGTEPKAKAYVEVCSAPYAAGTPHRVWTQTCQEVDALAKRLADDLLGHALVLAGRPQPSP